MLIIYKSDLASKSLVWVWGVTRAQAPLGTPGSVPKIHYQIKVHRLNKPIFRKLNYSYQTQV